MNSILLFDFTIDKTARTVYIKKEFDANVSLVWDAFTKKEIIDQWWAPKPLISRTKYMDFKVGGRRFYAMVGPEGTEIGWQVFHYTSIIPRTNFKCVSFFVDKDETPLLPGANWDLTFIDQGDITRINISIVFESHEELEKMIEMGFKEGFTLTLSELNSLLKDIKK